jgi:hypothetical protein
MVWLGWLACSTGTPPECDSTPLTEISVTVTAQEDSQPVEGATVELEGEPCVEEGGGLYLCSTGDYGSLNLAVLGGMEYASHAEFIEVREPGCEGSSMTVDIALLPAMACLDDEVAQHLLSSVL